MKEARTSGVWLMVALLLALPIVYVGSYVALVMPFNGSAYYRFGGPTVTHIFWPLEQVDRKVRPGRWQEWLWATPSPPSVQMYLCPTHWEPPRKDSDEIASPPE